jgi:hypothetical protein
MMSRMRLLLAAFVYCVFVAVPASAATVDPRALVVGPTDVPAGFRIDANATGVRTNALEAREFPATRPLFTSWKRVTGYQARFLRGSWTIEARVDLFRGADGARRMFEYVDLEARRAGLKGQKRSRVRIGTEGWVHWVSSPSSKFTLVVWRNGRVFSGVMGRGISRDRTLVLARVQQQHIAAALR